MSLPTPAQIDYMQQHRNDTKVPKILGVNIALLIIASLAIALRFFSRYVHAGQIGADDWIILVSLVTVDFE